jgi:hypothetical protein
MKVKKSNEIKLLPVQFRFLERLTFSDPYFIDARRIVSLYGLNHFNKESSSIAPKMQTPPPD